MIWIRTRTPVEQPAEKGAKLRVLRWSRFVQATSIST